VHTHLFQTILIVGTDAVAVILADLAFVVNLISAEDLILSGIKIWAWLKTIGYHNIYTIIY